MEEGAGGHNQRINPVPIGNLWVACIQGPGTRVFCVPLCLCGLCSIRHTEYDVLRTSLSLLFLAVLPSQVRRDATPDGTKKTRGGKEQRDRRSGRTHPSVVGRGAQFLHFGCSLFAFLFLFLQQLQVLRNSVPFSARLQRRVLTRQFLVAVGKLERGKKTKEKKKKATP